MIENWFIRDLGVIITAAALFALGARSLKLPSIVAYIAAGLFLGPLTGLVNLNESISLLSEAGIVLLLFLVGLELSLAKVRDVGRVAVIAGLGQVVFTTVGGMILCGPLGFDLMDSLFLSVGLTFSSTVVVVKLLDEKEELDSLYGRIAVGIFLVQDIVAIVLLTVLAGLQQGDSITLRSAAEGIVWALGGMTLLLGMTLATSRYLLPRPFAWAARSPQTLYIWSLCWCFGVVLVAHLLHLSVEIGAFLAGLALAQLPYHADLRRRVHPLMNFFIAVFFVSLGIKLEFSAMQTHLLAALILSLFVLLGNPLIFIWIIARLGYGERTAFLSSVTVAQISEFSFIFGSLGVSSGLIQTDILSLLSVVGIVTIALSTLMILYNHQLYEWFSRAGLLRIFRAVPEPPESEVSTQYRDHVIVVGMNTLGRELVKRLTAKGEKVVAVDTDPMKLRGLGCHSLYGNAEHLSLLEEAGLPRAKLLVSALQIEETNDLLAYRCKSMGVPCSIHAIDLEVMDNLLEMDVHYLMIPKVDGIKLQTRELHKMGILKS